MSRAAPAFTLTFSGKWLSRGQHHLKRDSFKPVPSSTHGSWSFLCSFCTVTFGSGNAHSKHTIVRSFRKKWNRISPRAVGTRSAAGESAEAFDQNIRAHHCLFLPRCISYTVLQDTFSQQFFCRGLLALPYNSQSASGALVLVLSGSSNFTIVRALLCHHIFDSVIFSSSSI